MEPAVRKDLVGLKVFSREDVKIGKIKEVIGNSETSAEYLVIGRFLSRDLVVPIDLAERSGDRVALPFTSSFLDMAPPVSTKGGISNDDRGRLEHYYRVRAAS